MPEGIHEHSVIAFLVKRREIIPDGSIGCVSIGEFAGDRSKDLHLTFEQARQLAEHINKYVGSDGDGL